MPEPGINDPDFNRPTTDRKKFRRRSKARVTLPGEYAGFRLKDGRPLGAVLGEGFFGPAGGVGEPMAKLLREQSREDNSPLARMIRNDPRFAPRREPAGGTVDRDGAMPGPPAVRIRPPDPPGPTVSVLPLADGRPRQFTDPGHSPFVQANAGEPARPAISGLADNPAAGIPNAASLDEEGFGKLLAAIDEAPRLSPLQRRQLAYIARGVRRGDLAGENIPTALRMTGAWARPPNLPDSSQPEDTAGETAWKLIENTPSMFKQVWGGLMMSRAESDGPMDRSEEDFFKNKLNSPNEAWRKLAEKRLANRERERESSFAYGAELYARATRDLMDNAPNVDPESLKGYGYDIGAAFVRMAPAVGATLASKGRAPAGMAVLGTQVYGQKYGEARASGRTDPEARQDATFYALSEAIPERIPLGILMKQGGKFLPRLTRTMAAEGVQEIFTEILQIGYEAGELGEDMTWGEAWGRIKRSGIIGSFVGGGMSTATHPFVRGADSQVEAQPGMIEFELAGTDQVVSIDAGSIMHPETGMTYAAAVENNKKLMAHAHQRPKLDKGLAGSITTTLYGEGAEIKGRRLDVIGGYSGSGKTTLSKPLQEIHGSLVMDVDDAKPHLPGYDRGLGESLVLGDAGTIVYQHLAPRARRAGDNVVWSAVGGNRENVVDTIQEFRDAGYEVYVHFVDLPYEKAFGRAVDRFGEQGRFVDPKFVAKLGNKPRETFNWLVENGMVDGYTVFDNDVERGALARLVEFGGPGGAGEMPAGLAELLRQWGVEGNSNK